MNIKTRSSISPTLRIFFVLCAAYWLIGCASITGERDSLYVQLGEEAGIAELVDDLLIRIIEDPILNYTFAEANLSRLRGLLEEQFCEISDGPCTYSGFTMLESHRGMSISEAEFNAIVEDLVLAMEDSSIPLGTQNRVLARFAPMYSDIVGH